MLEETKSAPDAPQPPRDYSVDASAISAAYANFARVTSTPEELILDFGLNTQLQPNPSEPIKLTHRLVLNFYTAKRLLSALAMAVQQHERVFGVLETDFQKRARINPQTSTRPSGQ